MSEIEEQGLYDIAIVGGGPAGLSAAINAKVRKKEVILFESGDFSWSLRKAPEVDNYLGMPKANGSEMVDHFVEHAKQLGTKIAKEKVNMIYPEPEKFTLVTSRQTYQARTVIIATGIARVAMLEGEKNFVGQGVSYCATCDGMLYRGKKVVVISEGVDGEEEANFLSEICHEVTYIHLYDATVGLKPSVKVVKEKPVKISGTDLVESIQTDKQTIQVDGVFISRKVIPIINLLPGLEVGEGEIKVNRLCETNLPGVYAAGDCTGKPYQIAKAAGEGQVAALTAVSFIDRRA